MSRKNKAVNTVSVDRLENVGKNIDEIERAIRRIDIAVKQMNAGQLNQEAIVVLLQDKTKLSKRDIKTVLDGLSTLAKDWIKQPKK